MSIKKTMAPESAASCQEAGSRWVGIRSIIWFDLLRAASMRSVLAMVSGGIVLHLIIQGAMTFILVGMSAEGSLKASPQDLAVLIVGKSPVLPLVAALLATMIVSQEYRYGSRTTSVMLAGTTTNFVIGKLAGAVLGGLCIGLIGAIGTMMLLINSGFADLSEIQLLMNILFARCLSVAYWGIFGVGLSFIARSWTLAIGLLFALPFVVEPGLGMLGRQVGGLAANAVAYLPFNTLNAIVPVGSAEIFGDTSMTSVRALLCASVYAFLMVIISIRRA